LLNDSHVRIQAGIPTYAAAERMMSLIFQQQLRKLKRGKVCLGGSLFGTAIQRWSKMGSVDNDQRSRTTEGVSLNANTEILSGIFGDRNFILVFTRNLSHLKDEDKLVVLRAFEACISPQHQSSTLSCYGDRLTVSAGFFPGNFAEIADLLKHNTFESLQEHSNQLYYRSFSKNRN